MSQYAFSDAGAGTTNPTPGGGGREGGRRRRYVPWPTK